MERRIAGTQVFIKTVGCYRLGKPFLNLPSLFITSCGAGGGFLRTGFFRAGAFLTVALRAGVATASSSSSSSLTASSVEAAVL